MSDPLTALVVAIAMRAHAAGQQEAAREKARDAESARQAACVTEALYFEARGEGVLGMVAVADVIENRTEARELDHCGVVHEPGQFTYKVHRVRDRESWELAAAIADELLGGGLPDVTKGATYYHARYVRPEWADRFRVTAAIGQHLFYAPRPTVRVASAAR